MKAKSESPSRENNAPNPPTPQPPPTPPEPPEPPVSIPVPRPTMEQRLSGPPARLGDKIPTKEAIMEHRIRRRCHCDTDEEAAKELGESAKTIARTIKKYDGPLLIHRPGSSRKNRRPLPPRADNAETNTDD